MESRVAELEFRQTHQEVALEELTQTNLAQQQQIEELKVQIKYLKSLISQTGQSTMAHQSEETPPPHY